MEHSLEGSFTRDSQGRISRLRSGGHGQGNIETLRREGIEFNIMKEYPNGVRVGVIRTNGKIATVFPDAVQP